MTEFAPPTPTLSFAFEARVLIGTPLDLGMVGGARKRIVPITGGRITGERFSGDVLPGGGATKVATELLPFRKAMYHAMMGENVDGKTAAEWGLVNEALPLADLKARVTQVAEVLLKKNPVALKATKDAVRRVGIMSYDDAEDYLIRAQEAANSYDNHGRKEGIKQFIDDKSFKPGLGAYDISKQSA